MELRVEAEQIEAAVQRVFDENGIRFAPRRVIVEVSTPALATAAAGRPDRAASSATEPGG